MSGGGYDWAGVVPAVIGEEAEWFDYCRAHRFMIQRCDACGAHQFPPRSVCVECLEGPPEWVEARGTGTVHTFSTQYRNAPGFDGQAPYTLAMVELTEGPRLLTRIVGSGPVEIGMPVELRWATVADGLDVPAFVVSGGAPA